MVLTLENYKQRLNSQASASIYRFACSQPPQFDMKPCSTVHKSSLAVYGLRTWCQIGPSYSIGALDAFNKKLFDFRTSLLCRMNGHGSQLVC
jgi:hypothetical protein